MLTLENKGVEDTLKLNNRKILHRNDGRWQGIYYEDGKRKFIYAHTQKECYLKLKEKLIELDKISPRKPKQKKMLFNEWIQKWIELYKEPKLKPASLFKIQNLVKLYVANKIGKMQIKQISQMDVLDTLSQIKMGRTRQMVYVVLKDCLQRAVENDIISKNPMATIPTPKHVKQEQRALSAEEEKKFLSEAKDSRFYEIYLISLFAGLRIGEVLALKGSDIKDDYIIVDETMNNNYELDTTKSGRARKVPIFTELDFLKAKDKTSEELLYPGINRDMVYKDFKKICQHQKIADVTLHGLRHTFATRCAQKQISAKQVQLWLGHSDIGITLRYYTNIDSEFEAQNIARKNK